MGPRFTLTPLNGGVQIVCSAEGQLVGTLKRIAGQWKFKAVGVDEAGDLVPGGGPLSDRHNTLVAEPTAAGVSAALGSTR